MTIQHVVLFRFPHPLDEDQEFQMHSIIARWIDEIETISQLRFGTDIAAARDRARGFQYLLYMEFADVATYLAYRDHEAHLALSAFIRPLNCEVLAFDYELNDATVLVTERIAEA